MANFERMENHYSRQRLGHVKRSDDLVQRSLRYIGDPGESQYSGGKEAGAEHQRSHDADDCEARWQGET